MDDRQPRCVRGRRAPDAARHEAARAPRLRGHRPACPPPSSCCCSPGCPACVAGDARGRVRAVDPAARHRAARSGSTRSRCSSRSSSRASARSCCSTACTTSPTTSRRSAGSRRCCSPSRASCSASSPPTTCSCCSCSGRRRACSRTSSSATTPAGRRAAVPRCRRSPSRRSAASRCSSASWCSSSPAARARSPSSSPHPVTGAAAEWAHRARARRRDLEERARAVPLLAARPRWPRRRRCRAYLHAAAMVKAGVYLVARLAPGYADTRGVASDRHRPRRAHDARRRLARPAPVRPQAAARLRHREPARLPRARHGLRHPRRGARGRRRCCSRTRSSRRRSSSSSASSTTRPARATGASSRGSADGCR